MSEDKTRFSVRMSKNIYDLTKSSADDHKRSVVKEIEFILDNYFKNKAPNDDNIEKDEKIVFTLRLPNSLYSLVKESAENNKRNSVKEIETILERYFQNVAKEQK